MADWINTAMNRMDPQPMGKGPGGGPWNSEQEQQFQTTMAFDPAVRNWRNKFALQYGEQPQIDDPQYDYRVAVSSGNRPEPVPGDTVPHWGSEGKASDHPTEWMNTFVNQFGTDPNEQQQWTPDKQEFMRQQLQREMLDRMVRGQ